MIIAFCSLYFQLSYGSEEFQHGCLTRHVKESIANNKTRKNLYRKLTNGESDFIFDKWVFFGELSIPLSISLDWRASNFQKKNIPVLCEEIPEMNTVKPFLGKSFEPIESPNDFKLQIKKLHLSLREAVREKNYNELDLEIENGLQLLNKNPHYYCMVRHLLESIQLTAKKAQYYEELESEMGTSSSQSISMDYIKSQLLILIPSLYLIDIPAIKFQRNGISIVCSELPEVK